VLVDETTTHVHTHTTKIYQIQTVKLILSCQCYYTSN